MWTCFSKTWLHIFQSGAKLKFHLKVLDEMLKELLNRHPSKSKFQVPDPRAIFAWRQPKFRTFSKSKFRNILSSIRILIYKLVLIALLYYINVFYDYVLVYDKTCKCLTQVYSRCLNVLTQQHTVQLWMKQSSVIQSSCFRQSADGCESWWLKQMRMYRSFRYNRHLQISCHQTSVI